MSESAQHLVMWLIPGAPLVAAMIIALAGKGLLKDKSHWPCWIGLALSAACAICMWQTIVPAGFESHSPAVATGYEFLNIGTLQVPIALRADAISALMLTMVTTVSFLVSIFAAGYMHHDPGYPRFFMAFSLFVFSMCMLVLSGNFLQLFVFWEAVGLCSYLLIGFWFKKPSAAAAAKKAFVVNRIGDFGLIIGMFLIWTTFGSLSFDDVLLNGEKIKELATTSPGTITLICSMLFLGAMGKSAQFPLHVWLPDAMEGPTPVSALIHAATMVTAGVYLVARCTPLFMYAPEVQVTISVIGAITALLAALIGLTQFDLKRVLAYSTVSQLGYMFMALGAGAAGEDLMTTAVTAGMFHLFTHGFFKALLFLSAGSVMHSMGDVIDMRRFSGLRKVIPITHFAFLCGALALAGFPLISGFWSKDEILSVLNKASAHTLYGKYFAAVFWVACGTAFITVFYTFRAYFLTFWGPTKIPAEAGHHPHDASPVMAWPLGILALASLFIGGAAGITHAFADYLHHGTGLPHAPHGSFNYSLMALSTVISLAGIGLAWFCYVQSPAIPEKTATALAPLYMLSQNKFYIDEILWGILVAPLRGLSHLSFLFDKYVIDKLVDLVGMIPRWISAAPRWLQAGSTPGYALVMWGGLLAYLVLVMGSLR